jgi:hypothetical protein
MLSAAAGWGELQSAERIGGPEDAGARHQFGGNTVVPNQGYYEAGIGLVDLFPKSFKEVIGTLQWFGVGVYTRFGPYAAPRFTDNLTYKMEIVLPFNR